MSCTHSFRPPQFEASRLTSPPSTTYLMRTAGGGLVPRLVRLQGSRRRQVLFATDFHTTAILSHCPIAHRQHLGGWGGSGEEVYA